MKNYIGLDVHFQTSTAVVINGAGKEILRQVIPTRERQLREFFSRIKGFKSLVFEEGSMAKWLVGVLDGCVDKLMVCNPRYVTKKTKAKTDYIDAHHLALELRAGNLTAVFHDHENPLLDLRLLISAYRALVRQHVQTKNRFKALFRSEGLELPKGEKAYSTYEVCLKLQSPSRREIAMRLLEQCVEQNRGKEKYLEKFKSLSKHFPEINILRELPGIDYIRAFTLAAIVGEANRFENKHHYWSYCGLVNHKQLSGGNTYGYKKSRGRMELKELYLGAIENCLLHEKNEFRRLYDRHRTKGRDHKAAKKAAARKMASVTLTLLKTGNRYDKKMIF